MCHEQFCAALAFYTRFPFERVVGAPDFEAACWPVAIVGALVGGAGGLCALLAHLAGLPVEVVAVVAIVAMALMTGALHEDGLADFVDGVGGGVDRTARLAIMRDSRLGSYGALALCASVLLRVFAIAHIFASGVGAAILVLVFVGAASRIAGLVPMRLLSPARMDGAAAGVRAPGWPALGVAAGVIVAIGGMPALAGIGLWRVLAASLMAALGALAVTRIARRAIGGYTGDVLGAAQQIAEIAALLVFCAR